MTRIGFIGLGEMGLPMARNLSGREFEVRGYDIREETCRVFREGGGRTVVLELEPPR